MARSISSTASESGREEIHLDSEPGNEHFQIRPVDFLFLDLNLPGLPAKRSWEKPSVNRPEMKLIVSCVLVTT